MNIAGKLLSVIVKVTLLFYLKYVAKTRGIFPALFRGLVGEPDLHPVAVVYRTCMR